MGAVLLATEHFPAVRDRFMRQGTDAALFEEEERDLVARYDEICLKIMPRLDKTFERVVGDVQQKGDFIALICANLANVEGIFNADDDAISAAYARCEGKSRIECAAIFEEAMGLDAGVLSFAADEAYKNLFD